MKFLLDASAMIPLLTRSGKQLIAYTAQVDLMTTDLAVYEACNGLWTLATLLKTIDLQEAHEIISLLKELTAKGLIATVNFSAIDLNNVLNLAQANRITFYDASYIVYAQTAKALLVTEDRKLFKLAKSYIKPISLEELKKEFANYE